MSLASPRASICASRRERPSTRASAARASPAARRARWRPRARCVRWCRPSLRARAGAWRDGCAQRMRDGCARRDGGARERAAGACDGRVRWVRAMGAACEPCRCGRSACGARAPEST
eukprot:4883926-Prymnesium_polylepis.1